MQTKYFYRIIIPVVSVILVITSAILFNIKLVELRASENKAIYQIVSELIKANPDIDKNKIAEILNQNEPTEETKRLLTQYGISNNEWLVLSSENKATEVTIYCVGISLSICFLMTFSFYLYSRGRKKKIAQLVDIINRINNKDFSIDISDNTTDELSNLKNEIYKTTIMLKENSEISQHRVIALKDTLSDISHQLKTPLTSILILVDNLLEDDSMSTELRREFLNDIKKQTNGISILVQELLVISRLDADTISFNIKEENASDIIEACVKATEIIADIMNTKVTHNIAPTLKVKCDKKWLCEALKNILKNCIEHTENGIVDILIDQKSFSTKIIIKDNGSGICKEDLPHIFERFYKGKNSSENSVGIGLALSKTIIEKCGGRISVSSVEGRGTEFEITL